MFWVNQLWVQILVSFIQRLDAILHGEWSSQSVKALYMLVYFCRLRHIFFSEITLVSKNLDPDQARQNIVPDLDLKRLQR